MRVPYLHARSGAGPNTSRRPGDLTSFIVDPKLGTCKLYACVGVCGLDNVAIRSDGCKIAVRADLDERALSWRAR